MNDATQNLWSIEKSNSSRVEEIDIWTSNKQGQVVHR